ncbi:tail fiber domain-containing protein [Microcoleus sp. herbarium2]|uniref:tail fiber domain-containing protein n=1 Tax=Microcoleus sp. herbarium2 TaxID=3055433 RepID=UPI002FCFBF35
MGKLTNLNPVAPIADGDLPASIARDVEYIAADTAHATATDPHPGRYRQQNTTQTFNPTIKAIGLSIGGIKENSTATIGRSGFDVVADNTVSAAYLTFHRPNIFACHFGLDTNSALSVGGWSFGNFSYRVWHENYGTPVWQTPSDRKLKKSIRPIPSALEFILACQPVSFQYNSLLSKEHFGDRFQREKIHYGFLATDFPLQDLVSEKSNGYLGLDYLEIVPFLCRAMQEQQAQINRIESLLLERGITE